MTDFNDAQLRRLDGTLLLVFAEAMRTRKLTRVADRLALTPSAVSHAVGRLRDIFEDPLFIRRADGIEPTERALALLKPVSAALDGMRGAFAVGETFDPARIVRTFRVAALDYAFSVVGGAVAARVLSPAPGVRLALVAAGRRDAMDKLAAREIDCAIGVFDPQAGETETRRILRESFVTISRAGHPRLRAGLDLDSFTTLDHVIVSGSGDFHGAVDDALAAVGRTRRVVLAIPQFFGAFATVASTDLIASVPRQLAETHAGRFGLDVHETPVPVAGFDIVVLSAVRTVPDRGLDWLLDQLVSIGDGERA
ncbi:LysR family transcriptional regulator [Chthonobacter rhizosphaerae]|uniref:LysR family transcriptional regulator n=1 Tax=Chthonobacter rhizosphaerae TaxID=2735553 RepID=UPI0015EF4AD8|nr:LysR family transcriptional regulator [Chthonobacter rhizosphaerae]